MPALPFDLDDLDCVSRWLVSRVLNASALAAVAADARRNPSVPFETSLLRALDISIDVAAADLANIPAVGAVVVVANHPHGALDGLALADLVGRVRGDVKILANHLLARIPELRERCFFVDPFDSSEAAARSRAGLRAAHLWLRRGGALIAFPSGEVAHRVARPVDNPPVARPVDNPPVARPFQGRVSDSPWKPTVLRLAARTGAQILPAFIDGTNRRVFYRIGRVHPALRTALLGRELLAKRGQRVSVRIGAPLRARDTTSLETVRRGVETLADLIAREIECLPDDARLLSSGAFDVLCTDAASIPAALREIGTLRERAYRAVGEGTGRDCDVDRFDDDYLHLFVWNREARHIVGAYRLGRTDVIAASKGVAGLYTRTLFRYDGQLLRRIGGPALELGRSFVRAEYQKNYSALLLLWRGIGEFVVRHPQYRFLFGPVSVSARYSDMSHHLLVEFLRQNHLDADLAALVDALHPVRPATTAASAGTIDDLNRIVAGIEQDGKGLPVLLRQYLKLNARVLGFNVDPDFGDALDALMLVDLTRVDSGILKRYLGADGAARFTEYHAAADAA